MNPLKVLRLSRENVRTSNYTEKKFFGRGKEDSFQKFPISAGSRAAGFLAKRDSGEMDKEKNLKSIALIHCRVRTSLT